MNSDYAMVATGRGVKAADKTGGQRRDPVVPLAMLLELQWDSGGGEEVVRAEEDASTRSSIQLPCR